MIRLFRTALMFYTRIPAGQNISGSNEDLNRATGFLPLIGLIVGGLSAAAYALTAVVLPPNAAVVIAMIVGVLATGSFHEDGFADTCDGLGGGWSVEDKLRIMKDSRVGSYALAGLTLLFLLKFALLSSFAPALAVFAMMASHITARVIPLLIIKMLPYVRADDLSKAKPVSKGISWFVLLTGMLSSGALIGGLYLLMTPGPPLMVIIVVLPLILSPLIAAYYRRKMGGYTGDLLGAAEQLGEVCALAFLAAL